MPLGDTELTEKIDDFIVDLKQGKQFSSYDVAYKTVQLLRILISTAKWAHASELIQILKKEGRRMMDAERSEVIVGNMVSHVCYFIESLHCICIEMVGYVCFSA